MEVLKLSGSSPKIKIGLTPDRHQVVFVLEDLELVSRLIEGDYPNYERIIPKAPQLKFLSIKTNWLKPSDWLRFLPVSQPTSSVFLSKAPELSANAPQIGQNQISLDARIEGDPLDIAFNYKFISDFLSVTKGDEIVIELNQPLTPGAFRDQSDPHFLHIIMPVRLQD